MSSTFSPDQSKNTGRPPSIRKVSSQSNVSQLPITPSTDITNSTEYTAPVPNLQPSSAQSVFRIPESPRLAGGDSQAATGKVAIPRLKRDADATEGTSGRSGGKHRVNHACEPCRHRKTKCSGERPICRHCQDFKIVCFYADGKRDRAKKQFGNMSDKVTEYERLLKSLLPRVQEQEAHLIRSCLDKAAVSEVDEVYTDTATLPSIELENEVEPSGAESEASAGAGSTGALDRTDEDFTREGARQTGFMGKNSEITWMLRVRQENKYGDDQVPGSNTDREFHGSSAHSAKNTKDDSVPLPEAADGFTIHDSSYHLDDLSIGTLDAVDPYEMPTIQTSQLLFSTYMQRVHPTFPVVGQVNISSQFYRYLANPALPTPDKWLAIINLMFAISAKYSHLIQASWQGDERDHLIYFSRARLLAVTTDTLFSHPDLQYIQVTGLMSFYLLCCGQINRAWTLAGASIRAASAVGLNMRNDSTHLKDSLKEIRYRLWWAIYALEHRLCSITGRMNCILDDFCTTPLPIPLEESKLETEGKQLLTTDKQHERAPSANSYSPSNAVSTPSEKRSVSSKSETSRSPSATQVLNAELDWAKDVQPNSSLYFLHMVQLTRLTQNIFQQLYNPAAIEGSWSYIQSQIKELGLQLDTWYRILPPIFDFRRNQRDRDFYEFRLSLGFAYYGTRQMINRPCLCRLDRKIQGQSAKSQEFNRSSAMACVEAAQDCLRLIPDEPNAVGLITVGPWWTILQWLVQAASVLMLEISFRAHHMPEEAESILESSKKAVRWLHALGEDNLSAKRAWSLCSAMLREAAVKIGRDVSDLPASPPGRVMGATGSIMQVSSASAGQDPTMAYAGHQDAAVSADPNMSIPAYQAFANYDSMNRYDQYFPAGLTLNFSMPDAPSRMAYDAPMDLENEFMTSAYHGQQNHSQDLQQGGNIGGMGEGSGFQ